MGHRVEMNGRTSVNAADESIERCLMALLTVKCFDDTDIRVEAKLPDCAF